MTSDEDIGKIKDMMEFLVKREIAKEIDELTSIEKKIYGLTGDKSQTAIVSSLKVAPNTVSNLWKRLESMGILVKVGKGYRKVV